MLAVLITLGGYVYFSNRPEPALPDAPRPLIWSIEAENLERLSIRLASAGHQKSLAWVRREGRNWYFDTPDGPQVDMKRWGGGIPLLLSAPGAERRVADHATDEQLAAYGLNAPSMSIGLTLKQGRTVHIEVGDRTPDGLAYYIRLADAREIYTVHDAWYHVLA
ncbi:MAG: hypothetical protein ETSY2_49885, partial [Candidatus Entotheonella gemina]